MGNFPNVVKAKGRNTNLDKYNKVEKKIKTFLVNQETQYKTKKIKYTNNHKTYKQKSYKLLTSFLTGSPALPP